MKNFVLSIVMVFSAVLCGCGKENIMDSVSRSDVHPTVVTDSIPVHDTTIIYHTDTLRIDSIAPGVMRIITDAHIYTGDWIVSGWNATINATHQIKTLVSENGNVFTEDSVVFTEVGTMSWTFQSTYTVSIDGPHNADSNGCPDLQATCTRSWTYNVPPEYAEYFVGNCEQVPYLTQGNGNQVTVKTTNGHETKQAVFQVNVNIPGPQITDVTATCVHDNWGNWHVINGGIQIDGTNTVTETTHYDNGTSTVTGTGTYACQSRYMFNSRPTSYDHAIDGTYPVIGNTVSALGLSMVHSHSHDNPIMVNGHNYTNLAPDCDMEIYQVTVVGDNITLNGRGLVNGQYVYRDYTYSVGINTPADTVNHFNGNVVYWCITASYKNSAQSSSDVDWFLCVVTLENGQYKVYYSPLASTAAGLSFTFKGTITSTEYNNLVSASNFTAAAESGQRCGLAMAYHHNDNTILDITAVKYSSNTNQVKYYYLSNIGVSAGLHSAHSAIGQTIGNASSAEPVREGGIKTGNGTFTFVYNGDVVK